MNYAKEPIIVKERNLHYKQRLKKCLYLLVILILQNC